MSDKKQGIQWGFVIGILVLLAIDLPMLRSAIGLREAAQKDRPDYPWPQMSELWKAGASGILFLILKSAGIKILYPFCAPLVKDQENTELKHERA